MQYNVVKCTTVQLKTVHYSAIVSLNTVQNKVLQYNTMKYSAVQHNTVTKDAEVMQADIYIIC